MLEWLGLDKAATVTGLIGSGLASLQGKNRGRVERCIAFLVGFSVAIFTPEIVIAMFELKPKPALYSALGFFLGYFGFRLMDAVMQLDLKEIALSWLKK
jgi:hypothetical protein